MIVTDIVMPGLDGIAATVALCARRPGTRVVLVTVHDDPELAERGYAAGALAFVSKQARLLSTGACAITGKYPFVGGGQAAAKVTDSVTGQVLVAAADRRVGGGSIETAGQWQWGDAENVIKEWSQFATDRLYAYTSGAAKP